MTGKGGFVENLVPIGRFSKMTRLSVKALRHYDEIGLLAPAEVDPSSGYRYYRPGQANQAEAIRVLRQVDMPLDEIAEVLAERDAETVRKLLTRHRERLEERLADQGRMLRFLARLIEREEGVMPYEVTVEERSPVAVVAIKKHCSLATIGDDIGAGFRALMSRIGQEGAIPTSAPFIIYHDIIDQDTAGDIEICIPVGRPVAPEGDVYPEEIPGGVVATTTHRGPYSEIGPAYHTLTGWIQEHGHDNAGPPREVYLNDPMSVAPEDLLTRVEFPIS